jgi:galactose oxidase
MLTRPLPSIRLLIATSWLCTLGAAGCAADDDEPPSLSPALRAELVPFAFGNGSSDTGFYYQLRSAQSHLCADVSGGALGDGSAIVQSGCAGRASERWYLRALSATTYQLAAQHSAKCMRTSGGSSGDGAAMVQAPCARSGGGLVGSVFTVTPISGSNAPQFQLSASSGECLAVGDNAAGTALVQTACTSASNLSWTLEPMAPVPQSDANGRWSPVFPMSGVVPISGAALADRKVLLWASWTGTHFAGTGALPQTVTVLFDPDQPTQPLVRTITNTAHNMFCPGTAMLADGRVLVSGGDVEHTDQTSIYDPIHDSWQTGALMHQPRWYNSTVTLPDGRALTLGGNRTSGQSGNGEIYDPASDTWTPMDGIALTALTAGTDPTVGRTMEHPRQLVAPDGRVFVPGPTPHMQWIGLSGQGSITAAGPRGDDETSQNDVTVMFDVGKLLKAGGNISYDRATPRFVPSSRNSYVIDINSGQALVTKIAPMIYPRAFANGVVLPNGQVFVAGGLDNGKAFSDEGNVKAAELFDPQSASWRELPPMAKPRPYHSIALLLTDGRVLVGGGGLCSKSDCAVNHPDVEIYSPPYLFAGARPTITSAPTTVSANGKSFAVTVGGAVTGFTLVRMASTTHVVDLDQRLIHLLATNGGGGAWTLTAPASHNLAPPGYYLLFALAGDVPSVGAIVKID